MMNREREFSVMAVEFCEAYPKEEAFYMAINQYRSELKRAITSRLAGEIDGAEDASSARAGAISDCIRWVDDLQLKPVWPLD
jgi:hypothetical protein